LTSAILSIIFTSGFVAITLGFAFHYWQQANYKIALGWSLAMVLSLAAGSFFFYLSNRIAPTAASDRRARIVVTGITGVPVPGSVINGLMVHFTNRGKMPAKRCSFLGQMQMVSRGNLLTPFPDTTPAGSSVALVEPNDLMTAGFGRFGRYTFTEEDFESFKTGDTILYVRGKFRYEDFPGCSHWTTFAYRLRKDLVWEIDSSGNDADDNDCTTGGPAKSQEAKPSSSLEAGDDTENLPRVRVDVVNATDEMHPLETRFILTNQNPLPIHDVLVDVEMWDAWFSGTLFMQPAILPTFPVVGERTKSIIDGRFLGLGIEMLHKPEAIMLQFTVKYTYSGSNETTRVRFSAERVANGVYMWFPAGEGKELRPEDMPQRKRGQ